MIGKTSRFLFLSQLLLSLCVQAFAQAPFTSSNLPIIVITTQQVITDDPKVDGTMGIIDNGPGVRNNVADPFNNFDGKIGIEVRGSTSQMFPKKQFGIELRDDTGEGIDASLLGMPKKDDWVLFAPYNDKSLMRDVLAYKLARDMGDYASRSRYCELVLNGSYEGVYVLLEKVKRDKNRVDIDKLDPEEIAGEDLTGGYIFKIDKTTGSGGDGWTSSYTPPQRNGTQTVFFQYDYPKQEDIAPQQKTYISNYVFAFETALKGNDFKDPVLGYANYIDVPSFVDYFIANEISKNPDAYRLSTYLYKENDSDGGKLFMGPVWDFNLAFGNVNYCTQGNPEGFVMVFNSICPGDDWLIPFWWERLFRDDAFRVQVSTRWKDLRQGPFKTATVVHYVDSVAAVLSESQQRNFARWPVLGTYIWPNYYVGNSFASEISWMKDWIVKRLDWMDANMLDAITGTTESLSGFSIHAFPNPYFRDLQVDYEVDHPGILYVDLYDLMGRKLDHGEAQIGQEGKATMRLTTPGAVDGTYILRARFGDQVITRKVIRKQAP